MGFAFVFLGVQILSAEQIRAWDQYTIQHEPIASIDLMERAASRCAAWVQQQRLPSNRILIFCGKGNNGGDGLAMARLLLHLPYEVSVFVLESEKPGSADFETNLGRLQNLSKCGVCLLRSSDDLPIIQPTDVVIDALFGSGLNKPAEGLAAQLIRHMNHAGACVVSIDLPSGLFMNKSSQGLAVVKAKATLTFQCQKLALLVQENAAFVGEVVVLDIGLHPDFLKTIDVSFRLLQKDFVGSLFKPRQRFSHKGSFGHALLVGGSYGKMGAMVLATKACLGAGAGLTTALVPGCGCTVLQTTAPEAMTLADEEERHLVNLPDDVERFTSVGIGPGMGTEADTQKLLSFIIRRYRKPVVLDADALNCLAKNPDWLSQLSPHSVLTPHPKEFDRLFGKHETDFARLRTAREKSAMLSIIVVLKSHHSFIALPDGTCYFNSTGNAGMAKGGSGDVLTGLLTSLLAQGYAPTEAALLGVYLHGWAGDVAAEKFSKEAMLPSQTVDCFGAIFKQLNNSSGEKVNGDE